MDSVLVTEEIAGAGVDLLRDRFSVDVELGLPADELARRIGGYDGLIVRSATRVTSDLIERAPKLRVIGRAGTGVDNVDVAAATRRGIIVANAPGSNMVAAAEHAIGLLLALARNIPQAHAALVQGRWERSRFAGVELDGKSLAVIGFGRIGQLVAARARALGMRVVVYDPFVSAERCRELQVTSGSLENVLLQADFVTLHAPLTDDTRNLINAERLHLMKRGCADRERRPRRPGRPGRAGRRAGVGPGGGRGDRRLPERAVHVGAAARAAERRRHAPPGRVHAGGPGQGRRDRRRAGGRGPRRRLRLERGEHPARRRGGHGGAGPVHPARDQARPAGRRASRAEASTGST